MQYNDNHFFQDDDFCVVCDRYNTNCYKSFYFYSKTTKNFSSHHGLFFDLQFLQYITSDDYWCMTYVGYETSCNNNLQNGNIVLSKLNNKAYND